MKKIPTLFERTFANHRVTGISDKVMPGLEWVLEGEGTPTVKYDGAYCAIIDGVFYKRYDAKKGKKPPVGAIPCCDPDPVTGHWPHWVKIDENNPADKWFIEAYKNSGKPYLTYYLERYGSSELLDFTYEAIGPHFQSNPYRLEEDVLIPHGCEKIKDLPDRSFESIREYFRTHDIEGIVFWKDGEPKCKIKRSDFGFEWPVKSKGDEE